MANYQIDTSAPSHFVKYTVIFLTIIVCFLFVGAYFYLHTNGYLGQQKDELVIDEVEIDTTPLTVEERVNALDSIRTTSIKPTTEKTNQILDKMKTQKSVNQESIKSALDSLK